MQKKKSHVSFDDLVVVVESTGDVSTLKMTTSFSSGDVCASRSTAQPMRPDTPFHEPKILSPKCSLSQTRVHVQLTSTAPQRTDSGRDRTDPSVDEQDAKKAPDPPLVGSNPKSETSPAPAPAPAHVSAHTPSSTYYDQPDVVLHTRPNPPAAVSQPNLLQGQASRSLPATPSCRPASSWAAGAELSSPLLTAGVEGLPHEAEEEEEEVEERCGEGEDGSELEELDFVESDDEELLHLGDDFLLDYMVHKSEPERGSERSCKIRYFER